MFQVNENRGFARSLLLAGALSGIVLAASVVATGASAGECPADQQKPDAREPVNVEAVGKTDTVIATIDVEEEQGVDGRVFRMRRLEIEPGGVVPWHSHAERPAIIYIVAGTIEEYSSDCAAPIVHKPGDVTAETKNISHWWKNTGDETVVLISADLPKM